MYEIFRQLLQKNHVTAYQVSKATGISQSTLTDWKNGRSNPKPDKLKKIADYFGVSVDYLLSGEEKSAPNVKETTAARLKLAMNQQGLKQAAVLDKAQPWCKKYGVRLSKSDLSQYVSGKVIPGQEKLTVLGRALGVSEAWLMGYDVPMDAVGDLHPASPAPDELASVDFAFLGDYKALTEENKAVLRDMVHLMRERQGGKEG